jgi:threonine aldolase
MMETRINLKTVQIEGGTIYPLSELAEIYKP